MHSHDWHLFDAEEALEIRRVSDDAYEIRRVTRPTEVVRLTHAEWDTLRDGGPLPVGIR